ncbi:MAG: Hsp20/alpha crystallin family protein [Myxococcota bacterium]|jgi:HSP20 family protein|nr:Hsp20/alpha crystallin family protein [Myxococcota bacterium]
MNNAVEKAEVEHNPEVMTEKRAITIEPAVDIFESADEYLLQADMPGLHAADIQVKLERETLSIEAKSEVEGLQPFLFRREFRVMNGLDPASVKAEYRGGVLDVHLPKPPTMKPRRISVVSG